MNEKQAHDDACRMLKAAVAVAERNHAANMKTLDEIERLNLHIVNILKHGVFRNLTRAGDIISEVASNFPIVLLNREDGTGHEAKPKAPRAKRVKRNHAK